MNGLPTVRLFLRLLINPGWAPLAVVVLHVGLAHYGLTHKFDHPLHFLGGASITYFLARLIEIIPPPHAIASKLMQTLLAFTSACAVALLWEFAEFASDRFRGTNIQQSVSETMLDLVFGVLGVIATLLLRSALRAFRK